ncbi:unnamed protein product [Adineta steineri]|uniref:DED domain-containing protein n=1 Tax=Adineta steineri TaxID=433720 RepID=A0A814Y0X4_9BILA|nr:unnamed protein product [Adineta steineri]CAF1223125.1 unnamed protein product [Adineta steineri]
MAVKTLDFRVLLIQLSNQLSNDNREGLHFVIGPMVPRKIRDDCTPTGTLHLLEFLFDRTLISDKNFDYLICAFRKISCYDAVERLQEFEQIQKQFTLSTTSTESTILNESIQTIEVDKIGNVSIDVAREVACSFTTSENSSPNSDCSFLPLKTTVSLESQPIEKSNLVYIIKKGFSHGIKSKDIQDQLFDDAKDLMLSYNDRCVGVELYWSDTYLTSIRFFYSNGRSSIVHHPSNDNQLNRLSHFSNNFTLGSNEEINRVIFYKRANPTQTNDVIVGIQFRTTKGRKSDLFGSNNGRFTIESFAGYNFLCAKGRYYNNKRIGMLQFVWLKSTSLSEKIDQSSFYVLDTCSFNYTSNMNNETRHATGIESSWYDLKHEFDRIGDGCEPGASYYRTISVEGPLLFAVIKDKYVFYHDAGKWAQYKSANNVTVGVLKSTSLHPRRSVRTSN